MTMIVPHLPCPHALQKLATDAADQVPMGQAMHPSANVLAPSISPKYPAPHPVHMVDPSVSAYDPGAHLSHVAELVAPVTSDDVPVGQLVHCVVAPRLNVPAWHCACTVEPSVTFQAEASMHARSEGLHSGLHLRVLGTVMLPAAAGVHDMDRGLLLKNPAAQGVQVLLPSALYEPAGQSAHSKRLLAPKMKL